MDNGHDVKHRKIITNIPQYLALAGTNLHYHQLSSNILNYLAQQQTSIFRQNMVCYANVRHMIEVKSHVNVCHVKIGHVKEFLVIFMGFIPMSRPVNVFYVNTKS